MSIDNEVNLFGIERITAQQFQSWSRFFTENYSIAALPRGFINMAVLEGLVIVPEDINNFYVRAFLHHFGGHFSHMEEVVRATGCYCIEDTIRVAYFFH